MGRSKTPAKAPGSAASTTVLVAGGAVLVAAVLALGVWLGSGTRGATAPVPDGGNPRAPVAAAGSLAAAPQGPAARQPVAASSRGEGNHGVAPAAQGLVASQGEVPAEGQLYQLTGAPTDADGLVAAEGGRIGQPAFVWFHADWCEICQSIKPTINDLQTSYEGRVAFIRMNVDDPASQRANRQYSVRGTPTFVLFDRHGQQLQRFSGWPGEQQVTALLDQAEAMQ